MFLRCSSKARPQPHLCWWKRRPVELEMALGRLQRAPRHLLCFLVTTVKRVSRWPQAGTEASVRPF